MKSSVLFNLMLLLVAAASLCVGVDAQDKFSQEDSFRQLEEVLPTPNGFRTASGAPGPEYWQQTADYEIDVTLDDEKQKIIGNETITYHNVSPDTLTYLWLQLDPNIFAPDSDAVLTQPAPELDRIEFRMFEAMAARQQFDGGVKIQGVTQPDSGEDLPYTVVKTMMRVDLPEPLEPGESFRFAVGWEYQINDSSLIRGRTGFEYFEEDGNYLYEMAQWFPRMCAYTDVTGWQHKQFLGRGEFTLEFGNYLVRITVPDDHIVASTGVLMNESEVLTDEQQQRLEAAKTADKPMFIVTPEEAEANETPTAMGTKTWIFKADNVRDFAFASSRKFIWDAQGHNVEGNHVMAMSFYPKEGEPLWSRYSTHSIIHTLNVYSRYTFKYPYPVAISVNGPVGGMEYPMICFNGPRPEADGTYSARTKYGLISVIIHEVGHNYFPMIVNHDERQWTWMDEGLNTFLQYLAEQEWEEDYPSRRGEPADIVPYMTSFDQVPIMTNSESIHQFGANAYAKPATALNVLRETILGRELFDYAFREYAQRWMFKRPMPADFFRTMEDASGVDLDWFWRGWFYSTGHVDIGIEGVSQFRVSTSDPDIENPLQRTERDSAEETLSQQRNRDLPKRVDEFPELKDFYNAFDELDVTEADRRAYQRFLDGLSDEQRQMLEDQSNYYVVKFRNLGGVVMPIILRLEFTDGTTQEMTFPAEIWRYDNEQVSKLIVTDKIVDSFTLDPYRQTADADADNNHFPPRLEPSRFELFRANRDRQNEMQRAAQESGSGSDSGSADAGDSSGE